MTIPKNYVLGYKCINCATEYEVKPFIYQCTKCGENLDVQYDYLEIGKNWTKTTLQENTDRSIHRYLPLLPIQKAPENTTMQVGGTPLITFHDVQTETTKIDLFLKDDTRNPSGSLKDRASEIGLLHADELGADILVAASTGNAAASLAALAAFHNKSAIILAPKSAPIAKLTQILQYGAKLFTVNGSYDDAFDLSLKIVDEYGLYSRSTGINPVLSEGKKTVILELLEQLQWDIPDKIFVPVGDGCIIGGAYKGLADLLSLGWIDHLPQLIAVQASGSSAIVDAIQYDRKIESVSANTIADSISVDFPRDGLKAIRAIKKTNGSGVLVTDAEILEAQKLLSANSGIFAEPAAASAFAGFLKLNSSGKIKSGEKIAILITGSGLKDIQTAQKQLSLPSLIEPTLEDFKRHNSDL
ncbi:threonine synthase [Candidatus Neomarinimicrobiota bacterium]